MAKRSALLSELTGRFEYRELRIEIGVPVSILNPQTSILIPALRKSKRGEGGCGGGGRAIKNRAAEQPHFVADQQYQNEHTTG